MSAQTLFPIAPAALPTGWPACTDVYQAAQMILEALSPHWPGVGVEVVAEIDSTNSELLRRIRAGRTDCTLLVSRRQTAGRGRLGRNWETAQSPALTMSLGLPLAPREWSGLSLVVGLVLAQRLGHGIGIKWPNDLWWQGRKLCGVLLETAALQSGAELTWHRSDSAPQAPRYAVIGMGLNLATPVCDGLRTPPVGLSEVVQADWEDGDAALDLGACAMARVLPELLSAVYRFEREGFAPFEAAYAQHDLLRGKNVSISDGRTGRCLGLAPDGALWVDLGGERVAVTSGEVSVRPLGD